jgi:hypothetical protein
VRLIAGERGARLILYAGEPQSTRVVMQGPFVGESPADISRLYEEYRQGRFPRMSELVAFQAAGVNAIDAVVIARNRR